MTGMIATFTVLLLVAADKPEAQPPAAPSIHHTLATLDYSAVPVSIRQQATPQASPAPKRQRSIGHKIAGGAVGTVLGFIAGAYGWEFVTGGGGSQPAPLPDGVIYGGPIGAAIGFSLGVKYF